MNCSKDICRHQEQAERESIMTQELKQKLEQMGIKVNETAILNIKTVGVITERDRKDVGH